jgi:hypothetical protein
MLIIDPDEGLKIVYHAAVIIGQLWIPGAIDSGREGHDFSFENVMPLKFSGSI